MYKYKVTIFTPTYNRGYIIENLYQSLKTQTNTNFEWIVIDDGSSDDTEQLFLKWIEEENKFPIKYVKKANGGKHRAINDGVKLANGELFFIVDSDDYLTYDAIERIIYWEKTIPKNEKNKFAGVAGCKGIDSKNIIGDTFKGEYLDATSLERERFNINGDKAEIFYTDILKKFRFPMFQNENFISECVVWNDIAYHGYKIRWFNEIVYICDYLEDGLTRSGQNIFINNPKGYALLIRSNIKFYNRKLDKKIQLWFDYYIQLRDKISIYEMARNLKINVLILYIIIFGWKVVKIGRDIIR